MIEYNRPRKIRVLMKPKNNSSVFGVVIPPQFYDWIGTYVTVKESGNCLILESGALPVSFSKSRIKQETRRIESVVI